MFWQSFRVTGLPLVRDGAGELRRAYAAGKAELSRQLPTLVEARLAAARLKAEMASARAEYGGDARAPRLRSRMLENLIISLARSRYDASRASGDRAATTRALASARALERDFVAVSGAADATSSIWRCVDPAHCATILQGMYAGVVACLASVVSGAAQKVGVAHHTSCRG